MKFIDKIENNSILICQDSDKEKILKHLYDNKKLLKFKIMSLQEFIKKMTFDYDTETIYFIMKEYNLNYENALIFINNLYYINENYYEDDKLKYLLDMKLKLIKNKLLIYDEVFVNQIKNYKVYAYLDNVDEKFLNKICNNISYIKKEYKVFDNKKIIEFENMYDEIEYVAYSINELLNKNININIKNIKLSGISSEYKFNIKQIFNNYNLDLDIYKTSIYSTKIGSYFINNLKDNIEDTLKGIKEKFDFHNEDNNNILNKIIDICNKYTWVNNYIDIKDCFIYEFKNTYINTSHIINKIEIVDIKTLGNTDDYIFLMGFNQENIPIIHKDDKYLTDKLCNLLNIDTSNQKNNKEKEQLLNTIKSIKNLTITYKKKSSFNEYYISSLNDDLGYEIIKEQLDYNIIRSNKQLDINVCKYLDNFTKYGYKNNNLEKFYFNTNIDYHKYNNKYKTIQNQDLLEYLDNKLLLSYSSIDKYYHCAFSYYISNILKLDTYEEKFAATIGSLIHDILSKCFNDNFNFEEEFNNYIENSNYVFSNKEQFFLKNIHDEIIYIIETIKKQKLLTGFDDELYEKKIYIELNNKIKVTFMGIIDKMMVLSKDNNTYISIIDYKTGNPDTNLDYIKDGLMLQLPIYAYLIKNSNLFDNPIISGIYYQKILNGKQKTSTKDEYEKEKYNNLKLIGLSTSNEEVLSIFDSTYENSELIKGMKLTSKGFSHYSKVFSEKEIEDILEIAKDKIEEATNNIINGNFDINPKVIKFDNIGCKFCKYKDLCYMTEKDKVIIKEGE